MFEAVIGLGSTAQVGKDTIANYLVNEYGFIRIGLADGVKEALYNLNPIIDYDCTRVKDLVDSLGWEEAKKITEVRELLQRLGTDAGRNIHGKDCWLDIARRKMEGHDRIVISDIRFDNESDFVRSIPSKRRLVINVVRPSSNGITANTHASEAGLSKGYIDAQIQNDSSLESLYTSVDVIMNGLSKI